MKHDYILWLSIFIVSFAASRALKNFLRRRRVWRMYRMGIISQNEAIERLDELE